MKLFIDDVREPPVHSDWVVARTSEEALTILRSIYGARVSAPGFPADDEPLEVVSFDHDLGGDDTTRPVMLWIAEYGLWPDMVLVHSANPVGKKYLLGVADAYAPEWVKIPQISRGY